MLSLQGKLWEAEQFLHTIAENSKVHSSVGEDTNPQHDFYFMPVEQHLDYF